jgi:putative transposase
MVEKQTNQSSTRKQCELLSIKRNRLYYVPRGISEADVSIRHLIDQQYTKTAFNSVERMTVHLHRAGVVIGHNRVRRLMRLMGLTSVYPKRRTSVKHPGHKIYPYLPRDVQIERVDQVWSADITYIRLLRGFVCLAAILDWFSRYVLSWSISTSLDSLFCLDALDEALEKSRPQVFNTDQGSQFTSKDFTCKLKDAGVKISMDGKGRAFDNIFVELFWRAVKYEEVYLKEYRLVGDALDGIGAYIDFYNNEQLHQSLEYRTPAEVCFGKLDSRFAS